MINIMNSYITIEKQVLDWKFKKFKYGWNFYIGDILLGQLFSPASNGYGWSAISWSHPGNTVNGFISRYKASEYLIEIYDKNIKGKL